MGDYPFGAETQMAAETSATGYFLGFQDIRSLCLCRMTHKSCHFFFASCLFRGTDSTFMRLGWQYIQLERLLQQGAGQKKGKVSFGLVSTLKFGDFILRSMNALTLVVLYVEARRIQYELRVETGARGIMQMPHGE